MLHHPLARQVSWSGAEHSTAPRMQKVALWDHTLSRWSKAVKCATLEAASSSTGGRGWDPTGRGPPWECQAARGRQARPEEAQEPGWGAAKGP